MKPTFAVLQRNFPAEGFISSADLFREIGWDDLIDNPTYENTCAIRMSLALIKSGIKIPGRIAIHKGRYTGSWIEMGQARLCNALAKPALFGKPEIYSADTVDAGVGARHGVIAFYGIPGYLQGTGGHIDIIETVGVNKHCGSGCYFDSTKFWFWELD